MRRRLYETERNFQQKKYSIEKKGLQGIKRLVPYRRLPINPNTFRLRLLHLLGRRLISYSDEVFTLPSEDSFDIGNIACSDD